MVSIFAQLCTKSHFVVDLLTGQFTGCNVTTGARDSHTGNLVK